MDARLNAPQARPLVSVVICCHKPELQFLRQAIDSVLRQTLKIWELIIVEASPSANSAESLAGDLDCRVRYCRHAGPPSLAAQRNRALELARGEFIAVLDADDIAEEDRLRSQVEFLSMNPDIAVVGSHVSVIDCAGRIVGQRIFALSHEAIVKQIRSVVPLCHPSVMYRRDTVVRAGGYCDRLASVAEDYELYSRLAKGGARFANLPEFLTRYRIHSGQIKARRLRETIRAVVGVKRRYWLDEMNLAERLRMTAESALTRLPRRLVWWLLMWRYYRRWGSARRASTSLNVLGESRSGDFGELRASPSLLNMVRR